MNIKSLIIKSIFSCKYREEMLYLFFGGIAFLLNIFFFTLFHKFFSVDVLIANALSWGICVSFQYITNKVWVFESKTDCKRAFLEQMFSFMGGRIFTLIIEEFILVVFIEFLEFNSLIIKLLGQVVVIIMNYVISKSIVFKKE